MNLIQALKRDHVHAGNIAKALEWLRKELSARDIPFALVGGLALRYHGYTRFTEDIDLLTTKEGLDRIHRELVGRGLTTRFAGARKSLRETGHNVRIDVITAGENAGSNESPVLFPAPASRSFVTREGMRVPTLATLVTLKLASGLWGQRSKDFGDVAELIKANALTKRFATKLPTALRARFLEELERTQGEKTLE